MDIRKLSEEERKKYIDGFKEYVANRNNSSNSQMINSVVDNAFDNVVNNTSTRGNYSNNNDTWNRVQNIANNNLNRFNSMQNMFDRNTRNQMAKPMENYTNTKRMAMQNASKYVQENAVQQPVVKEKNIWDKIKEKLQIGMDSNRVSIYRDSSGKIDRNKTALGIAQQNFEADKQKLRMLENKKAYDKAINEQLKNTWSYKEVQRQNPDATEEELLKITKEKDKKASQEFIESLVTMNPVERNAKIEGVTHNKNAKYALKSQVQAVETQKEADKINQDIQNGNYWSSIGHVARGLPEGAMNAVIKTTTALESLSGQKSPSFVSHNTDPIKEAELQARKYQEITSKIDNGIVQTGSGVTNTIGEMTPSMVTNIAAPGYGAVVNAMNVGSSSYLDALNEDGTNKGQALLTGALKATASYGIEKIAGGNFLSEGSLDDWAAKTIASKTSSKVGRKIASMIYNVGGEVLEEELENQVDYLIDATINGKGITLKEWLDEQGETVKNTALTQLTLGLFGLGGDTYKKANEYSLDSEAKKWINEAQRIIDKENLQIDTEKIKERELLRSVLNQVNVKENDQVNNESNLQQKVLANNLQRVYNSNGLDKVKNVPIESILHLKTDGGYRNEQYMAELRKDIKANGIKYPIELVKNNDGSIEIENGNHRLQVANELGLKEVPIKFVESWDNIGKVDKSENRLIKRLEVYHDRNNTNSGEINILNGRKWTNEEYGTNYRNKFENREATTGDDRLYNRVQAFDNRPSSTSTFKQNFKGIQELENTSSFNLQSNTTNLQQNTTNNQINSQTKQINRSENKMSQNGNMKQTDRKQTIKGYHGTDANFENYSLEHFGKHDEGDFGKAVYFSTDKSTATKYGKNVKENNINLENPLIINNEQDYKKMWNELGKRADKEKLSIEEKDLIKDKYTSQTDKDYMLYNTLSAEEKKNILQEMGYDGVIDNTYNQIAVFNPNNIENNSKTVYNNTESEGGIDGRINQGNDEPSRIFEEGTKEQREYSWDEYNKWEQSIKPIEKANITDKEQKSINKSKIEHNKDIYLFDENNNDNTYSGGASPTTKNKISISRQQAEYFGLDFMIDHETIESDILQNIELYEEVVKPVIEKIKEDKNFAKQIEEFWKNEEGNKPSDNLIAKDIFCDRFAQIRGNELKYTNILSQETNMNIDYALDNFYKEIYGKELVNSSSFNLQNNSKQQINTNNQLNEVKASTQSLGYKSDTEGKQRKHYKSVMESDQVGEVGKKVAEGLVKIDTYQPISNIETLATANEYIAKNGLDNTYIAFKTKMNSNERITLQDVAIGERLIQIFSQNGEIEKYNDLMQDVVILGTEVGQIVQAFNLIKKQSPEGQLMFLNKMVDRLNLKENTDLKVTDEMSKRILEAKSQEELESLMNDVAVELGEQLPITMSDKIRAWRYLSMLGNPKTHDKNILANVAMNITQRLKNKVAGATEDVVGMFHKDMERTKTLRLANKDQRNFAKQDAEFMKDKIDGGGKYDIKNAIQKNKKQFNNKVLNAIAQFNSDMLELEDNIFLKTAYKQALQNYMSANKLSSSDMQNSSVLQKAREYASYQAQEATFHQFSALAQRLTEIENKGGIAGKTLEAVVPFKKTPINIAKSGVEYSPIGLAKSLTYDIAQLNKKTKDYKAKLDKGFISKAEYKTGTSKLATKTIDNMAKGLTGTSLALLGYALKDMGILKSGNDGEDDEFKEKLGEQEYAIRIGDNTYTLDWVSPSAIPMFMGATVHDLIHSEKEDNSNTLNSLMTSSAKAFEPMTDMSMLQGLTSAISSYEQGSSNMLFDLGGSAVSSYLGQFVPTALGQVAKTIDDKERDTSSTEKGLAKKVEQFKKQQMAKIPIVSKMLPVRKDVWGNEKTRDSNILVRAYEVGLAPYNRKKVVEDYTEKELLKVFEDTGEKAVLPGIPNKDITINKQKYRLTAGEYNKAKETFGKTSEGMLDSLVKSKEYESLTDNQKAEAINNIYSYAKEKIKVDYAKSKKQEIETTPSYNVLKELNSPSNQSEYLSYSSKIKGIEKDKEKKQILSDGNYSVETKAIIYKNTLGKEDDIYNNVLGKDNININEYLKYKLQEFESDKEENGTKNGKSISGSKKKKVSEYVDNLDITKQQKLAILGTQYKLNRKDQEELYNYLNKLPMQTREERLEVFSKYSSNFVIYENDTMDFK